MTKELETLQHELLAYREQDPLEIEKKSMEMKQARSRAEQGTDRILAMESWLKAQMGGDSREQMMELLRTLYKDEFDEEEQGLREL